MKEPQESPEVE
jgi:hypothetical protein